MKSALHNLGHKVKLSANMGELIPIAVVEALPGDVFDHSTSCLVRTQPLVAPVYHEIDAKIHHWYVPTRDLWDDFPDFITGGPDGADNTVAPYIDMPAVTGATIGSLADYLGVPTGVASLRVSALPFRAYARIYNEYYRDQDLQTELAMSRGNGADTTTNTTLQFGCWEKDYFTSARLYPQKGPAVTIPLTGYAPVEGIALAASPTWPYTNQAGHETGGVNSTYAKAQRTQDGTDVFIEQDPSNTNYPLIRANLADAGASIDMEDLRLAAALQRYEENLSRFGSRYVERIMAAFGFRPRSLDLDLPVYLGGGQQKISISEVLATAEGTNTDVGDLKGHGITAMKSNRYRFPAPEHGYIVSMLVIRPRTGYMQGLNKLWSRDTKEDYYQPELAYLGQQPILNKEVYAGAASPNGTFGYQDAYESYRYMENRCCGEFRDTLKYWHMDRIFASEPALNADFVKSNPTDRIYAIPAADQLYVMAKHRIAKKSRVIKYAKPQLF